MRDDRTRMTVVMYVTRAQAIALREMFRYWDFCGSAGCSRDVTFFVDGDGDFHPKPQMIFDPPLGYVAEDVAVMALVEDKSGDRRYDYDPVAGALRREKEEYQARMTASYTTTTQPEEQERSDVVQLESTAGKDPSELEGLLSSLDSRELTLGEPAKEATRSDDA